MRSLFARVHDAATRKRSPLQLLLGVVAMGAGLMLIQRYEHDTIDAIDQAAEDLLKAEGKVANARVELARVEAQRERAEAPFGPVQTVPTHLSPAPVLREGKQAEPTGDPE